MSGLSLCILGNSHAAAVKRACGNDTAESFAHRLTFFAAGGKLMGNVEVRDGAIVPREPGLGRTFLRTSGVADEIVPEQYDAFVLLGLGFKLHVAEFGSDFGTFAHLKWGPVKTLLSESCFAEMGVGFLESSLALGLIRKIRSVSSKPILMAPVPFPSESRLDKASLKDDARMQDRTFLAAMAEARRKAASTSAARHGFDILWQDEATIGPPGFTRAEFSADGVKLSSKGKTGDDADGKHMNEEYGRRVLGGVMKYFGPAGEKAA